jgi:hypothetical protein
VTSEDRFGDLGEARRQTAAERLAEMDEHGPPEEDEPRRQPETPRPRGIYTWLVGVAFFVLIVVALFRGLNNEGAGVRGPEVGKALPAFAAPLADGNLDGDANVRQRSGDGSRTACQVRGAGILNSCDLREGGKPVAMTFIVTRGADCEPQLDRIERVRREFPDVRFVGVVSGDERKDVQALARKRGWRFPVAVDPDGAVVTLAGVGVCPTTTFADNRGIVRRNELGNLDEAKLREAVRSVMPR